MAPTDPISKFIPEFANLQVFKGVGPDGKLITTSSAVLSPPDLHEMMRRLAAIPLLYQPGTK